MEGLKLDVLLSSFVIGLKGSIFDILCFIIALFFLHRVLKFIDLYGGGYLSGEDERGGHGGGGVGPERGGDGLGGGVGCGGLGGGVGCGGLGGGGGRAVKDSIKYLSKLILFFLLGDGGRYLSEVEVHGEDERGELGDGGG